MGSSEVLLSVPGAQLHKVEDNLQTLLVEGDFTVAIVGGSVETTKPEQLRVEAAVDQVAWPLGKHLPALKAADTIYSFALEHTKAVYYCLILPAGLPADVLDAVHDVLHDSCAFSTAKQVDAAYEEADKLKGSREAAAMQAAEAAGATPEAAAAAGAAAAAAAAPAGAAAASTAGLSAGKYVLPSSGNQTADRMAAGLLWGGTMVATAVSRAAVATAGAIQSYTQKQMASQQPNQKPAKVSPTFKRGLALAGTIASSAVYVTGQLAALVGKASYATALAIAKSLPGHKKKKPGELVSQEERSVLHTVGAAGLVAFVDVYDSLEGAAKVVLAQSAEATSQYIEYKYGPEAGAAAAQSVPVAQDMLTATMNFSRLGARAFISKTAKKSAKFYLKSTVAGLDIHEQAGGARVPSFAAGGVAAAQPSAVAAAGGWGSPSAAAAGGVGPFTAAGTNLQAGRVGSSSNLVGAPYPQGAAAVAASGGIATEPVGGGFNTAAAQQAARANAPAGFAK